MLQLNEIYNSIRIFANQNTEITNNTYASKVHTLLKSGVNIENFNETVKYTTEKYTKKTRKSVFTSLTVFFKSVDNLELASRYSKEILKLGTEIQDLERDNEPSKTEKENMVTRDEIIEIIKKLESQLLTGVDYFETYKKYLVINLYHLIPPVRNDFVNCEVHYDKFSNQDLSKNYIFLNDKVLVLNRYKTRKSYGTGNEIKLPVELSEIIKKWMDIRVQTYPLLSVNKELLLTKNLQPMTQVNLTQFLNRIFNKKVSSTILRKSYLSEKYPVTHSQNELQRDASAMQHSVAVQQSTYRKRT
jgi:hypothetical protein